MRTPQPDDRGYSLIEMVVVLCVVSLLLAAGLPTAFKYLRSSQVAGAMNMLIADIHQTRSLSTAQRRTYQIAFDAGTYSILEGSPATVVRTRELPRGIACSASDTATFYAWGLTLPVDITLENGSAERNLQVSANGSVSHD